MKTFNFVIKKDSNDRLYFNKKKTVTVYQSIS